MPQEVSFHPGERRRIKSILKTIGPEYWCVMETSQRVLAGQEELKAGVSKKKLLVPVGVHSGHFFGCVQTAHSGGLGGAVHTEDYEAHVVGSNVLPMGS